MEHREPPRIGSGDHLVDAALKPPHRQFPLHHFIGARRTRPLDPLRVGMVLLAGLAVAVAVILLGSWTMRTTYDWLAIQAPYQIPFKQMHLVNPPPPWFLGGKDALLEGVRKSAGEPETISVLKVTAGQLAMSFKKYAWVEGVKVSYAPGQIDVELRYHQPVAWVQLSSADQIVIDEKGNILPVEDVDATQLRNLIIIVGSGLTAPADRQPGVVWKVRDSHGLEQIDERIVAAAKLASFLLEEPQKGDGQRPNALRILKINVSDFSSRGLFIYNAEDTAILWGKAPGEESPGKPTAAEKWAILRRWQETESARFLVEGDFWSFSNDRLRHVCPSTHKTRHQPGTKPYAEPGQPLSRSLSHQDRDN